MQKVIANQTNKTVLKFLIDIVNNLYQYNYSNKIVSDLIKYLIFFVNSFYDINIDYYIAMPLEH